MMTGAPYKSQSKLKVLLGEEFIREIQGRTVVDFGCGEGHESVDMVQNGAARVIGVDIRPSILSKAREWASEASVADRCAFTTQLEEPAEIIVSVDAFEHFQDPAEILEIMARNLRPGGRVFASFGPTWYHPLGGHLFSVFPWAHLIFSEAALIRWRNDIRNDGASRFREVEGGLNQMTIRRFEQLVAASPFHLDSLELVPIRQLARLHNRITREFTTAIVRCRLVKN